MFTGAVLPLRTGKSKPISPPASLFDKAGGYGIQGKGALLVESIQGVFITSWAFPVARLSRCCAAGKDKAPSLVSNANLRDPRAFPVPCVFTRRPLLAFFNRLSRLKAAS